MLGVNWNNPWPSLFARGADRRTTPRILRPKTCSPHGNRSQPSWLTLFSNRRQMCWRGTPKGPPTFNGKLSGTVAFYAFHDAYHVGQIGYLRKWLGYGKTIG